MFLKADSKSGLTTIATIGPLLIDESPPLARETPEVVIEDPYIMTQWNNDTFYDLEQSESIHQVYYQFGKCPTLYQYQMAKTHDQTSIHQVYYQFGKCPTLYQYQMAKTHDQTWNSESIHQVYYQFGKCLSQC